MPQLNQEQKLILNVIQDDFPIEERPFHFIDKKLNLKEGQTLKEVKFFKQIGLIRQISPIYDTRKLGYKSTLVAFKIQPEQLEEAIKVINRHPGVSHNYERTDEYNIWFTIAVPPEISLEDTVKILAQKSGAKKYMILPTLKLFKIGVKLDVAETDGMYEKNSKISMNNLPPNALTGKQNPPVLEKKLTKDDIEFIKVTQETIPIEEYPFKRYCEKLNITFNQMKDKFTQLQECGIMRRFAAILRHRNTGFSINAMVVWQIPQQDDPDKYGNILAHFRAVSHCYIRPSFPDFPYSLYTMVHTKSIEECNKIINEMKNKTNLNNYKVLVSTKELKKIRLVYFSDKMYRWYKENGYSELLKTEYV